MPQDCERTWTYHLQSAWRHGFSLNSQPLIKSILSLESGHTVEYASIPLACAMVYALLRRFVRMVMT
jgi:hypothetical protein